ncbi:sensor histidine kinase [Massilia glaciei]|uniref:Histidine kinase/HSP90-like ATPase domain-containing protein n=1 Tax=Massilia glaciei TaxID=1524097 RepID=A0A2U2HLZ5_9BURK|nr:histidine kinase [Massilia glaciei]PWF48541.1 hypothetical protein C7C56_011295 [Massilia glaciei]
MHQIVGGGSARSRQGRSLVVLGALAAHCFERLMGKRGCAAHRHVASSFAHRFPCSSRQSGTETAPAGIRRSLPPAVGNKLYRAAIDINGRCQPMWPSARDRWCLMRTGGGFEVCIACGKLNNYTGNIMKYLKNSWAGLKHARDLINEGGDMSPKTGVWMSRLSRGAIIAQFTMVLGVVLLLVAVWFTKDQTDDTWALNAAVTCGVVVFFVSWLLAMAIDKHSERAPTTAEFLKWAGLTVLLGLPAGHLILFLAARIQTLAAMPSFLWFLPELMVGVLVALSYLRFAYVHQWHERLSSEALKRHSAEQGQALAEARLTLLQAQIEPHFLFNTLASVQHLVRKDPENADFLLTQLISYLRQAIPDVRGTGSVLGREFGLVKTYLNIVRVRMGGRLEVDVQFDPALAEVPFPTLIIHTLVENAIKHGVELKPGPVGIAVRAARVAHGGQARIDITVRDNGPGFGAGDTVGTGVGLVNIRDRLAVAYQGRARLDIADAPGGGVCATVSIPESSI